MNNSTTATSDNLRIHALALDLGVDADDLNECSYDDQIIEHGNNTYLVVTDDEADDLWDTELDNYLNECVYPNLPESLRNYFDDDAWKSDARHDGRAHSLNRYDGNEAEVTVWDNEYGVNVTFFIYRQD